VAHHQECVEALVWLIAMEGLVDETLDTAAATDFDRPGGVVESDDIGTGILDSQGEPARSGSDVEHSVADQVESPVLDRGEAVGTAEVLVGCEGLDEPVITFDDVRTAAALEMFEKRLTECVAVTGHDQSMAGASILVHRILSVAKAQITR
jgi:hypothetical protein